MDVEDESSVTKKIDNPDNVVVSEKAEVKKCEKSDAEDPKPRIVLTFRSEKSNTKSTNMKIVSSEEKQEEISPRRSSRTRGKWDWVCDSDTSVSPKKDKSQPASDNDESDNSHTPPKRTRRRSKDENIIANAIARKQKSYNEATPVTTQRLSRRIKPTPKILANEELRMGLESRNNARLGIQADKSPEDGVKTRRSARPSNNDDKPKVVKVSTEPVDVVEVDTDSQNSDMKLEHLCKLGLKAIGPDDTEDSEKEMDDIDAEILEDEDEEEVDDDSEVISKLLQADEDTGSDDEYLASFEANHKKRDGPLRRSARYGNNRADTSSALYEDIDGLESDRSSPLFQEDAGSGSRAPARRSSRRAAHHDDFDRSHRSKRKKRPSVEEDDEEMDQEEESNPAAGDEGSEAACPAEQAAVVATCFCETPSNVYASMDELTEPIFCQAIEIVDGVRVGCSHPARKGDDGSLEALVRAGPRAPYFLACLLHARQLANHMCCPACGLFCTQGIFYQCSQGHLFHLDCGIPHHESKAKGCPHCGVNSYRWHPANSDVAKVKLEMKCSNKRIFLPDQREQCTPAYLSFTTVVLESDPSPVIPEDLLPSAAELKLLCEKPAATGKATAHALADAILAGEGFELLIPKIVSGPTINKALKAQDGGTCLHVAAKCGHLGALYLLHNAGANLNATDTNMRTPLMAAVVALLDKPEAKNIDVKTEKNDMEVDPAIEPEDEDKEKGKTEEKAPKDGDLIKVIRYLVAAGCDVNFPDLPESMTPLHVAAHHGSVEVTTAILNAPDVNIEARDQGGWTPLVWAAENGHEQVVRLLLHSGADAASTDSDGNSVVHWCALAGCGGVLQVLLHSAPHLTAQVNAHADTPLHVAARQGHYACVVILLARGARSDVENTAGELPIDVCTGQCENAISLNMQMSIALKGKIAPFKMLSSDISNGRELFPIPCVNEVDDEPAPADFTYVTHHVTPEPIHVDTSLQTLQGCQCTGACNASCACSVLSVRDWWRNGRLLPTFPYRDPPMLFHCGPTCACNKKRCGNNVLTRLLERGAQFARAVVYRVGGARGWGLRAAGAVPRGAPVAVYCGELLPLHAADARPDDSYMFALDVKRDLLEQCTDKTVLCVDARRFGSAARFMNHACRPNLVPVRVFDVARDLRLPRVALVAAADVQAGEAFTFDYGDKFWAVKSKWMKCECGSPDCRYPTKAEDSEAQS